MKTLLIDNFHVTKEGIALHFNEIFSPNNDDFKTDELWVSWDRIGKALLGDKYCEETQVAELNKIRRRDIK